MEFLKVLENKLFDLRSNFNFRSIRSISNGAEKYITIDGKKLLNLASNNYLGLTNNKVIKNMSIEGIKRFGTGASSSRLITGNNILYDELEREISDFKNKQNSLVLNSGYCANLAALSIAKNCDIFMDRLCHASLIDGAILIGARFHRFKHNDLDHLEKMLKSSNNQKVIVTESVFSMDGDKCDLVNLVKLSKEYDAFLILDEAHATGIFGNGRGLAHEYSLENDVHLNVGTFSKALGSLGGYLSGDKVTIEYLINFARSLIYTTALPPSVIAANLAALKFIRENPSCGAVLLQISDDVRNYLKSLGFETLNSSSQIIPIVLGDSEKTLRAQEMLFDMGLFVAAIREPTVPTNFARLRISLRSDLNLDEVKLIKQAFTSLAGKI
ncbi:8-amino-7-oxononanoate synthase [Thermodesulfobium narugense DSM 14796]|uniref:8-amino-7-oxononanoate synthase n=1 Tax=Thermodesulfobium narugense DSM 14796 TaxID=747365 RepID=M1E8X5_9BACT|nr:8-amino-7-oxononanoate synthase [Thermodesulfobium narugense]AEE15438.1 8-amino-7-oxononanoate synthase [Thermodesulfobium narugense DSM 14796]